MAKSMTSKFGRVQPMGRGKYRLWPKPPRKFRPDGSRDKPSEVYEGDEEGAWRRLAELWLELGNPPDRTVTYGVLWAGLVKPSLAELSPRTADGHKRIWDKELRPRIAAKEIGATTRALVESVLGEIDSPWVQRSTLITWRKMYNMAGLDRSSPFDRSIRLKKAVPAKRPYLDASEVSAWIGRIRGQLWARVLAAEAGGGLRHEEACALTAEDVKRLDHAGRTYAVIRIDKALVTPKGGRMLKDAKNGFSERVMVVGAPFAEVILDGMPESGPLCPTLGRGTKGAAAYMSPSELTSRYKRFCKDKNLVYVNPGKLRGSWRTMHSEAKSDSSVVRKAMGHAGVETDERNYLRLSIRSLVMLADNLTDFLSGDGDNAALNFTWETL